MGGSQFHPTQGANEHWMNRPTGEGEIVERPQGVYTPESFAGNLARAERVRFFSGRGHAAHGKKGKRNLSVAIVRFMADTVSGTKEAAKEKRRIRGQRG